MDKNKYKFSLSTTLVLLTLGIIFCGLGCEDNNFYFAGPGIITIVIGLMFAPDLDSRTHQ